MFFDEGNKGGGEAQSQSDAELRDVEATHGDTLEQLVTSPNFSPQVTGISTFMYDPFDSSYLFQYSKPSHSPKFLF